MIKTKKLTLELTQEEYEFLLDILEEAMLLPYDTEEYQEIAERAYRMVKEQEFWK